MKSTMLFKLTGVLFLTLLITYLPAQVKIGDNPASVNASAILELEKTNKGLLITRVSLASVWDVTTIPSPANSLLVYNTNFGGGPEPVSPGFYYWREDQGRWVRLITTPGGSGGVVWIDGNQNILSANSANQSLEGYYSVVIGERAFADDDNLGASDNVIAIGVGAAQHDSTVGDARNIAIGYQAAFNNKGYDVIFMGREAGMNNKASNVIGIGDYAGYQNRGGDVNALGTRAAYGNQQNNVNAFGAMAAEFNTGFEVNALGPEAARYNSGFVVSAMGTRAAALNTKNDVNAFGFEAAYENDGERLNAFGTYSATNNTGDRVNALGWEAAWHNTGGSLNAMGENAGYFNSGDDVNAFGFNAANNNQGGSVNAMGNHSAYHNTGSLVNAFGGAAGENNTGWSVNVMGNQAGQFNEGSDINAMGAMAAQYNTTANINAFGLEAARYNTGYGTNAMGWRSAMYNNGANAVAIGDSALIGNETGDPEGEGNIGIGYHAGINVGTGYRNICLGWKTPIPNPSANDQINIGNNIIRESYGMIRLKDFIRLTPLAEPPSGAEEGSVYYDIDLQKLRVLTGSGWVDLN